MGQELGNHEKVAGDPWTLNSQDYDWVAVSRATQNSAMEQSGNYDFTLI